MTKRILAASFLSAALLSLTFWQMRKQMIHDPIPASLTEGKVTPSQLSQEQYRDGSLRFADIRNRLTPHLKSALSQQGVTLGSPVFLRSFKDERILELWMQKNDSKEFKHVQTWKIACMSGDIGPKLKEGDRQSPEGFYHVSLSQFLPSSTNHLAFNVGFPNAYDRSHNRTGSFIMVQGHTGSIGCLAMTDPYIEEIYTICHAALSSGKQEQFQIQMLPFRLTDKNLSEYKNHKWHAFWKMLKSGYDYFEDKRVPPNIIVSNKSYKVSH